jgi:hypothetical protein
MRIKRFYMLSLLLPSSAKPQLQLCWLSVALLSLLNSPPVRPVHPVKVSEQLSTAAGKLEMEDNLNFFVNGRLPHFFL